MGNGLRECGTHQQTVSEETDQHSEVYATTTFRCDNSKRMNDNTEFHSQKQSPTSSSSDSTKRQRHEMTYIATNNGWTDRCFPRDPSSFLNETDGNIPLILSAPHGGTEQPDWIPNLSSASQIGDLHTLELTNKVAAHITKQLSRGTSTEHAHPLRGHELRPFVLSTTLHRKKMDANREINEGTEGGEFATMVYEKYHSNLRRSCREARRFCNSSGDTANNDNSNRVLLIDVHGYSPLRSWNVTTWEDSWIMVGHCVSRHTLSTECDGVLKNADWIRGRDSVGSLLEEEGLLAEPSFRRKVPRFDKYYSGGYITSEHRTIGEVETVQLEFPRPMRENLDIVAPKIAAAIVRCLYLWGYVERPRPSSL